MCKECHNKLTTFYYFKQEIVSKQEKLYQMLDELNSLEVVEQHEASDFDEVKPEVNIKTETGFEGFKVAAEFESIDYDVHSGELK